MLGSRQVIVSDTRYPVSISGVRMCKLPPTPLAELFRPKRRLCNVLTGNGFTPLSSLSSSPPDFYSSGRRVQSEPDSNRACLCLKLPTPANVEHTHTEDFHPDSLFSFDVNPTVGFERVEHFPHTLLVLTLSIVADFFSLLECMAKSVSRSPPFSLRATKASWGRMVRLLLAWRPRDYFNKPPSNWTGHSRGHPALRVVCKERGNYFPPNSFISWH